ncbi:MAG: histidine--tRNA ligase [Actinobacteria bacterium]|nr:histidine--tRNA ligase [Actinomycetota bacterium]
MEIKAPKGIMDILPPESSKWREVAGKGTALLRSYGYREIMLPVMEYTEVFARGIGQGTDIVQKEMFTFEDKGGRSLTLRPEATAGVARAFVQHHMDKAGLPVKLYYQGPMFRHERPQAGRYRQFRQLGIELIGSPHPSADAEVILVCSEFFSLLGIGTDLVINSVGDAACRPGYIEALKEYLAQNKASLCRDCRRRAVENPLRVLDCKVEGCAGIIAGAPGLEGFLCEACREHYREVIALLEAASVAFRMDGRLVRGLDYYTRTVFEFQDPKAGGQNAIAAGGRYDDLIGELGGKPTPATGFSIGMERVMLAGPRLEPGEDAGIYIMAIGDEARSKAFLAAYELRKAGIRVDLDHLLRSPKAQMREADRGGFALSVIIGEDEMAGGYYTLREMLEGSQERVEESDLVETVIRHLERWMPTRGV